MTLALSLKVEKGSVVVLWNREDYLIEAYRQFDDKEVYEQVPDDLSVLANTLIKALEKLFLWGELPKDTHDYFLVKDLNLQDFICYQEDQ